VFLPIGQQGGDTVTITPTSTTELLLLLLRHGFFFNHKHKQKKATTTTTINNNRGTNPPLHKHKQTQQKKILFLCKNCKFCTNTKFSNQFLFFLGGTISFAELQVLHQHNCIEIFWSNKHNQFLMFPNGKVL
jgi:hypothetical protein